MSRYAQQCIRATTGMGVGSLLVLLAGCASLAPATPDSNAGLPAQYLNQTADDAADAQAVASLHWQQFFADARLRELIGVALENNRDLRLAALRVQEAQAAYGIQRSQSLPTLAASAQASRSRTPADLSLTGQAVTGSQWQAGLGISSWEIDFWGRVASLNEAALQTFLATDAARQAAILGLIGQVAHAYLGLRELDERLQLAQASEASQRESLRIFTRRFEVGAASRLELTQVQTLLAQAQSLVVQLQQQRAAQLHTLGILLGSVVDAAALPPAPLLVDEAWLVPLQAGLPAALLQHRPDIVAAEHRLQAARANIGAARAAFYPSIRLTATGGTASQELEGLFKGAGRVWSFAPSLSLPIFDAGRNRANLNLTQVRQHMAVAEYENAIQNAFRDVSDALAARQWLTQQVAVQQQALTVQRERVRLSRLSYEHGASTFLEVLDAERSLLNVEQQLVQTRRALLASQVSLYTALGGGSQQVAPAPLLNEPALPDTATQAFPLAN